jgi:predicted NBD/HSP70 family sugar kinase
VAFWYTEEPDLIDTETHFPPGGVNSHRMRNHNERLLLSMIHRHGALPGSDLARQTGLSPQTVSVILRKLETDGLVEKGAPQRGRVGKPSVPMALAADGLQSVGLKIGRRTADLMMIDFHGQVLAQQSIRYRYPRPDEVFGFLRDGLAGFLADRPPGRPARVAGIGIAAPFELWNWHVAVGATEQDMAPWRDLDFAAEIAAFSDLPVFVQNDATAACRAEHVYGGGSAFSDYAYFFLGAFIGGGVVLNGSEVEGRHGNAGAFGSLPVPCAQGTAQLIDTASIHLLEKRLQAAGADPQGIWALPQDWTGFAAQVTPWIRQTSGQIAQAIISVSAVLDLEAVLIDGAFPADVRAALVAAVRRDLATRDMRGLFRPDVVAGQVGRMAQALGAASTPVFSQYFLDSTRGLGRV